MQITAQNHKLPVSQHLQFQPLYDAYQLEHKPVPSLRAAFNHWIRSLPMEERFLALKIYSGPLPQILRKSLGKLELCHFERCSELLSPKSDLLVKLDSCNEHRKPVRKLQKGFYDSLVFISDGQDFIDHICFEFGLLECPEKLFDLLTSHVQNSGSKLLLDVLSNRKSLEEVASHLMVCTTFQELMVVTLKYLLQEILLRFRQSMLNPEFLSKKLEEEKRRKKQFSVHLKHLSQDLKRKMVLLGFNDIEELKQWFRSYQIKIDFDELEREAEELLRLQKNQFSNRIFKCKLKKATGEMINYHEQIYVYWKTEVVKSRKRKCSKKLSIQKVEKEVIQTKFEEKEVKIQSKKKKPKRKKSISVQSNETNVTWQEKKLQKRKLFAQIVPYNQCLPPKVQEKPKQDTYYKQPIDPVVEQSQKKKSNRKRKPKQQKYQQKLDKSHCKKQRFIQLEKVEENSLKIQQSQIHFSENIQKKALNNHQQIKQLAFVAIEEELQCFSDKISQQANVYHDRRIIAFERIQFLLSYYYIQIQLFGSCASGIAIRNSDIDLAVKNSILAYFQYLPEHLRLLGALENLQQIFASQNYISDITLISTASIPIIKLKIDTGKPCLSPHYGQIYQRLNRPHNSGLIEADITIQTLNLQSQCNHLGIISTQCINEWLRQIPSLHNIVITLKALLQKRGLHKTYEGGLNTFSMVVLVVSCIYHLKLQTESNSAFVLEQVLRFYVYQFDQKQTGIDLLNYRTSSIFYPKKQRVSENQILEKADLQMLDPKCKGKNMTRKCYLFSTIKEFFKQIYQKCFEVRLQEYQKLLEEEAKEEITIILIKQKSHNKPNSFQYLLLNS